MNNLKLVIFTFFSVLLINSLMAADFDIGKISRNTYINKFFSLSMPVPDGWFLQDSEGMKKISETGTDLIAGDNENLKSAIKASEYKTWNLLSLFKYEPGSAVESNPSILMIAENIEMYPGIKTGQDYLFHTKKALGMAQIKFNIEEGFTEKKIGRKIFYNMLTSVDFGNAVVIQKYYACVINGYALVIITTQTNDDEGKELENIINKIEINE